MDNHLNNFFHKIEKNFPDLNLLIRSIGDDEHENLAKGKYFCHICNGDKSHSYKGWSNISATDAFEKAYTQALQLNGV
jgi:hypothetical protein